MVSDRLASVRGIHGGSRVGVHMPRKGTQM
jgi:hypothetical protein